MTPTVPAVRIRRGYSVHLGGPWYLQSWPDSGCVTYAKDRGTGVHPVSPNVVPAAIREKAEGYAKRR